MGCSPARADEPAVDGAALYDRYCLACHGSAGDGAGPGAPWLWPRPRDFTRGEFKWRTTGSGVPPRDEDLAGTIREGVPGTSMHPFGHSLSGAQVEALIAVVRGFAPDKHARAAEAEVVSAPAAPVVTDAMVARGRAVFTELGCNACHGDGGRGDGPSAAALRDPAGLPAPPYDLTAAPIRRPGATSIESIYLSLLTGLDGTAMPSYNGAAPDADLWAVAAFVDSIRYRPGGDAPPLPNPTTVDLLAVSTTGPDSVPAGYWPGNPSSPDAIVWAQPMTAQGEPPASLAPAQASLHPRQCGRCHAKQLREWRQSLHSKTGGPGLVGQVMRRKDAARKESCKRCHTPLREQMLHTRPGWQTNPHFDEQLRDEGAVCASCHLRNWTRYGPPRRAGSGLLADDSYPREELPIYERADFCLPCHQLPPWIVKNIEGAKDNRAVRKPLLNTYREWLEGPYMRRGVQCQHCHMPNREHTFLGVHDPETFRQGYELDAITGRSKAGVVSVRVRMTNVGAAHYLPTTPTPAAWLSVQLVDGDRAAIAGAYAERRIGRHIEYIPKTNKFREIEDTRIPPDESIELAGAWRAGDVAVARYVRIQVRVEPDEYYERLFESRLRGKLPQQVRALFSEALANTRKSKYIATERYVRIGDDL